MIVEVDGVDWTPAIGLCLLSLVLLVGALGDNADSLTIIWFEKGSKEQTIANAVAANVDTATAGIVVLYAARRRRHSSLICHPQPRHCSLKCLVPNETFVNCFVVLWTFF